MDLYERLSDSVNSIDSLPFPFSKGFLDGEDTLCVYPLAGSRTTVEYFDGTKEREMLYEIGFKTKNQQLANRTLWLVSEHLEQLSSLISSDGSFLFGQSEVSEMPFVSEQDAKGITTYLLDLKVTIDQVKK